MREHTEEHVDEGMLLLQANLDDMNPELTSAITDRLFEAGANDVYWIPIIMKRGRPAVMLNVLLERERLAPVERLIFAETTTFGLRYTPYTVHRLAREFVRVETRWGPVSVKVGYHNGELVQYAPEFRECEAVAQRHGVPLKDIYDEVRAAFRNKGMAR